MNWISIPCNRWTIIKWLSPFSQNVPCGQIASLRTDSNSHHHLGLVKFRPGLQNLWCQTPWRWVSPTQKCSHKLSFFPSLWSPNLGTQNGLLLALALTSQAATPSSSILTASIHYPFLPLHHGSVTHCKVMVISNLFSV